jgi:transketolase
LLLTTTPWGVFLIFSPSVLVAVADTLFTIRSDIAEEWQADLQLISAENAELFRHHKEMMVNQKDEVAQTQHPLMQSGDNDTAMRKANYDLLEKYCTHVATEQVNP